MQTDAASPPSPPQLPEDARAGYAALSAKLRAEGDHTVAVHDGLTLRSHFQPIFSLSRGVVVGHEALLRASDAQGRPISPPAFFATAGDSTELLIRERLSRTVHIANYHRSAPPAHWLFLNTHPDVFASWRGTESQRFVRDTYKQFPLQGHQTVIEVLEESVRYADDFQTAVQRARSVGCLLALDDFGAGHSNFDRVWRLQPDIVKLDRSLVIRAASERRIRRMVTRMVSLLHECGALVLMEGVETQEEAYVALESDADLAQGFYFGRPQSRLVSPGESCVPLVAAWEGLTARRGDDEDRRAQRLQPLSIALQQSVMQLQSNHTLAHAARSFLALPGAQSCYLLDSAGMQVGEHAWAAAAVARQWRGFEPLRSTAGARCAMRPYYRRAVRTVGEVQITRPYRTVSGGEHLCVTVSIAYALPSGQLQVLCGDVAWNPEFY